MAASGAQRGLSRAYSVSSFLKTPQASSQDLKALPDDFKAYILKKATQYSKAHKEGGLLSFHHTMNLPIQAKKQGEYYFRSKSSLANAKDKDVFSIKVLVGQRKHKQKEVQVFYIDHKNPLGEGASGQVLKAVDLKSHALIACKQSCHYGIDDEFAEIAKERENLARLDRLVAQCTLPEFDLSGVKTFTEWTLMNYYPGQSLRSHLYSSDLSSRQDISFTHLVPLCIAILEEVHFIHEKGMVLRDIKPENFIIQQNPHPDSFKLAFVDLGSALSIEDAQNCRTLDGTSPGYVAPEMGLPSDVRPSFSPAQDYYSMGLLLAEILSTYPFQKYLQDQLELMSRTQKFVQVISDLTLKQGMPDIFGDKAQQVLEQHSASENQTLACQLRGQVIELVQALTAPLDKRIDAAKLYEMTQRLKREWAQYALKRQFEEGGRQRGLSFALHARRLGVIRPAPKGGTFGDDTLESLLKAKQKGPARPQNEPVDGAILEPVEAKQTSAQPEASLGQKLKAITELLDALKLEQGQVLEPRGQIQMSVIRSGLEASQSSGALPLTLVRDTQQFIAQHDQTFPHGKPAMAQIKRVYGIEV